MNRRPKEFYLLLLGYALVEIRDAEGDDVAAFATKVADTLHHLPEALTLDWSAERDGRVYEQLRAKAGVHGLRDRLDAWERAAIRRLEHERGERPRNPAGVGSVGPSQTGCSPGILSLPHVARPR